MSTTDPREILTPFRLKAITSFLLVILVFIVGYFWFNGSAYSGQSLVNNENNRQVSLNENIPKDQTSSTPANTATLSGTKPPELSPAQNKNTMLCVGDSHRLIGLEKTKHSALQRSLQYYVDKLVLNSDKKYAREYLSTKGVQVSSTGTQSNGFIDSFSSRYAQDIVDVITLLDERDREDIQQALNSEDFKQIESIIYERPYAIYYALEIMDKLPEDSLDVIFGAYGYGDVNLLRFAILYQLPTAQIDYLMQSIPNYQDTFVTFWGRENVFALAIRTGNNELLNYFLDKKVPLSDESVVIFEEALLDKHKSLGKEKTREIMQLFSGYGYQLSRSAQIKLQGFLFPTDDETLQPNDRIVAELTALIDLNLLWTRYVVTPDKSCAESATILMDREVIALAKAELAKGSDPLEVEKYLSTQSKIYVEVYRMLESERIAISNQADNDNLSHIAELTSTLMANGDIGELVKLFDSAPSDNVKMNIMFMAAFNKISAYDFQNTFLPFLKQNPQYVELLGSFNTIIYLEALEKGGIQIKREFGRDILYYAVEMDAFIVFDYLIADVTPPANISVGLNALEYYILSGKQWDSHRESLLFEKFVASPAIASIRERH